MSAADIAALPPAERRFVNAAVAAIYRRDFVALDLSFSTMAEDAAARLGRLIADRLFQYAQATHDFSLWAAALHHLPRRGQREAAAELAARLDAWAAPSPARPVDDAARRLRALACRLIRGGASGRELLRRLREAAATLPTPVQCAQIDDLALWAARAVNEARHAAR